MNIKNHVKNKLETSFGSGNRGKYWQHCNENLKFDMAAYFLSLFCLFFKFQRKKTKNVIY